MSSITQQVHIHYHYETRSFLLWFWEHNFIIVVNTDPLGYRAISASCVRVAKVLKSLVLTETTACGEDCSNKCLGSHHPKLGFVDFGFRGVEFVGLDC